MTRKFRNIPIRRKLTLITMLTSCVALLLACAAFVAHDKALFRKTMVEALLGTAEMVGDNSSAALTFNEPTSAEQTLKSLSALPHIVSGVVYDRNGKPFSTYYRAGASTFVVPAVQPDGHRFGDNSLELFRKIDLGGERLGTVYIQSDLEEMRARLYRYAIIVVLVMIGASLAAFLISRALQKVISEPISHVAGVAHAVATEKNYSLRAVKQSDDELGQLVEGFNEMLNQIQQRDSALQTARNELEQRVEERTGELAHSVSLLNATLDSAADGVLALQSSGKVTGYNTRFAVMWNVGPDLLGKRDGEAIVDFLGSQATDAETFTRRLTELRVRPEGEAFDVVELKDGRTFERYIHPQRIGGETVGIVISFRDITDRKQAEANLETAHRRLMDASRQAGMAEVATGVLHNVGNVLNSVNVSTTLVAEQLKKSKISSLARVVALLEENASDLGAFFNTDPKGRQLPAYLAQLASHLAAEQSSFLSEMEQVRKNIEHIKDIVAMQQSYAKVSGVTETIKATDLVEDALRLNSGALLRHQVEVVREYEVAPTVVLDKHKVLQILVNLIRNAKYACDDSPRPDKKLIVRVSGDESRLKVSVIDNGVGIPAENLTRIFNHGFTTRKDGHGFGLHSGALAAKELGGSLSVQSHGPGTGAAFTLELPIMAPENPPISVEETNPKAGGERAPTPSRNAA